MLYRIQPILFPQGEPTKDDIGHTHLTNEGKFIVCKQIQPTAITLPDDQVPLPKEEDWKVRMSGMIIFCISAVN